MNNLCSILIVDDEYLLRQGLRYLCNWEKEGFTIIGEAASGEEAIGLVKTLKPNIVITDIVMSEMDGIELTKQIKSYDPLIEIIVLSSYSDFDYVKKAFKYGARDYILKPKLQPNELLPILKNLSCSSDRLSPPLPFKESLSTTLETLINGFVCNENQLNQANEFFANQKFFLLLADTSSYGPKNKQQDLKTDIFPNSLINQYMKEFTCSNCILIQDTYAILINIESSQVSQLDLKVNALTNCQHEEFNKLRFAISTSFSSLDFLKSAFENTKELLSYHFFLENKILIKVESIVGKEKSSPFDFDFFYVLVESLDVEKVNNYLISYVNLVSKELSTNVF